MANSADAAARTVEVRPARVWQPTDLLHPIAPEGGFMATPWRISQMSDFDPHGFSTPVIDLQALPAPSEDAPQADAASDTADEGLKPNASTTSNVSPTALPLGTEKKSIA